MAREMVTVQALDRDGNLTGEEQHELMVRRPRNKPAYAVLSSSVHRNLISDHPPVIQAYPPRPVQPVSFRDVLADVAQSASGRPVRIIGMFDQ